MANRRRAKKSIVGELRSEAEKFESLLKELDAVARSIASKITTVRDERCVSDEVFGMVEEFRDFFTDDSLSDMSDWADNVIGCVLLCPKLVANASCDDDDEYWED